MAGGGGAGTGTTPEPEAGSLAGRGEVWWEESGCMVGPCAGRMLAAAGVSGVLSV